MAKDLYASRGLAWRLFIRDISAQFRQSILGYVWFFLPPLAAALPFIFLNSQGVVRMGETPIPYGAYALVGTTIWQVFVDALTSPLKTVTTARQMLIRINFPREAILLAALAQVGFGVLIRVVILAAVFLWYQIVPPATVFLVPAGFLGLILFGFMIGVLITPLGVLYKDVQQSLPIITTFLMFLTPVLYPPPTSGAAAALASLNPLAPLVTTTRDWLTIGSASEVGAFLAVTGGAAILLFACWIVYRVALPHLIARLGS
jgi:lipopolysaccharide transport system permease protein